MRYVQTAAVTSHAALTRSPRDNASHANALAPMSATKIQPSHESNLPMRVPSLGYRCRQIGRLLQWNQPWNHSRLNGASSAGAASSSAWLPLHYQTATVTASLSRLILLAMLVDLASCARPAS